MKARDVMTTQVVTVRPETPAGKIALLLLKKGISAVPVVADDGAPLGMVSEGDLMPRNESEREARRDWWLKLLAEGEDLHPDYLRHLEEAGRSAREIMSSPLIAVEEEAGLVTVAEILSTHRIKRVPVLRDGRIVGVVSRADLVKAVAKHAPDFEPAPVTADELPVPSDRLAALTRHARPESAAPPPAHCEEVSATEFRKLVTHYDEEEAARRANAHHVTEEKHHEEARKLLAAELSDQAWHRMLHEARLAAQKGAEEHLLLRFPCELCSDHGRAVNAPDPSWPTTLRGIAAQVFRRWKQELRARGFVLHARVIDFPDGLPGDIGLFLAWGR
jgi:CBS domain-containing protein